MKRIKDKITSFRKKPSQQTADDRITNETVAEHREQILAGGRRFKYPVQYSRHKLVINSIIIAIVGILVLALLFWWQLYIVQNSSKFMYRFTQLLPVPVARIEGENVSYSDYLKRFRSSIHYLQEQNNLNTKSTDGKKEVEYRKREELNNAIRDAYVRKLAREAKVSVSGREVDNFIKAELASKKVSEAAYERTVLNNFYDWSMADYRSVVHAELLKRKVMFAVDTPAREKSDRVMAALRAPGADFGAVAKAESDDEQSKPGGGDSGSVPLKTFDPNGVIAAVSKLQAGQTTELIYGTDGYYVAKLTSKNDQTIQFQFIKIALNEFNNKFIKASSGDKVREFIKVQKSGE
ncbi:MAG: SurA N-terminal domain-containing protein [Candidatus Saccharimonadales bacterium]